jgi:hypothetical protein
MHTIAKELTPEETHAVAVFYGAQGSEQTGAERQPTAHHPG